MSTTHVKLGADRVAVASIVRYWPQEHNGEARLYFITQDMAADVRQWEQFPSAAERDAALARLDAAMDDSRKELIATATGATTETAFAALAQQLREG